MAGSGVSAKLARLEALLDDDRLDLDGALSTLSRERLAAPLQTLLARAALTRMFDRDLYDKVLAADLPEQPGFADFVKLPEVEFVPGAPGAYWIASGSRAALLAGWEARPEERVRLHRAIADFLQARSPPDALALLHHLAACDPKAAAALFESEFAAADAAFDLARCHALLDVLRGAKDTLGPELAQVLAARQQRYLARSLFADAYHRTVKYFTRQPLHDAFAAVCGESPQWILNIYATGGMGKTMFLRWVVARELVPRGVPCARLDFDECNLDAVRRRPWLALLPLCEQLNPQLPRPFLTEILEAVPAFRRLLQPVPGGDAGPDAAQQGLSEFDSDGGDRLVSRMGYALRESGAGRLVAILDTLEVVTAFPETFERIFDLVRRLHDLVPGLRLVLAGRYHVAAKVPSLAKVIESEAKTFFLTRFDDTEAADYLRSRGIHERALIDAVVDKVREQKEKGTRPGCNPFKLALLADLVLGKSDADVDFVRTLPSADYQYLLERVIKRIHEQPLRWVVRYGAIPRRLTFDYMEEALVPLLRRVLKGEDVLDAPQDRGRLPADLQSIAEQDIWIPEPDAEIDAAALWNDLLRYESTRGWISHVSGTGEYRGSLQFHSDVAAPMRDLLSYQPVFPRLQDDAVQYFERMASAARDDPKAAAPERLKRWTDAMCEVVFHRVQRDPGTGIALWRSLMRGPEAAARPDLRLQLAQEVLRPDYADDERVPRERRGVKMIDEATLVEAHLAAAEALETLLRGERVAADVTWTAVRRHVDHAANIAKTASIRGMVWTRIRVLVGAVAAKEARFDEAMEVLGGVLAEDKDETRRLVATSHLADALAARGDAKAAALYEEAIGAAKRSGTPAMVDALERKLASLHFAAGRLAEARDARMRAAREAIARRGDGRDLRAVLLDLADIESRIGEYGNAVMVLRASARLADDKASSAYLPGESLTSAELCSATAIVPGGLPEELSRSQRRTRSALGQAQVNHARAILDATSLRLSAAARHWDEATRLLESAGGSSLQGQVALHRARTRNRVGGHREVPIIVENGRRAAESAADFETLALLDLELAVALARAGDSADARKFVQAIVAESAPFTRVSTQVRGRALALAIAFGAIAKEDALANLVDLVEASFPTERYLLLEPFRCAAAPISVAQGWLERMDRALAVRESDEVAALLAPLGERRASPDLGAFARGLARVDLHRVFGDAAHAVELLDAIEVEPPEIEGKPLTGSRIPRRLLVEEARARIGAFDSSPALGRALADEQPNSLGTAALAVTYAEALLATGGPQATIADLLERAQPAIEAEPMPTRWHAKRVELRGWLARRTGRAEEADRLLSTADGMYAELGDAVARAELRQLVDASGAHGVPLPSGATAERDRAPPPFAPASPPSPASTRVSHLVIEPRPSAAALARFQPEPGQIVVNALAEALAKEWRQVAAMLGEMLYRKEDEEAILGAAAPLALRLRIPHTFLAALPWELAAVPGESPSDPGRLPRVRSLARVMEERPGGDVNSVRFVQRTLARLTGTSIHADGIRGPQTLRAMEEFARARGLPATGLVDAALIRELVRNGAPPHGRGRILVVQPGLSRSEDEEAGYASRSGAALEDYYGRLGAELLTLSGPGPEELGDALKRMEPVLIHLVAATRATGGAVFLDLARRRQAESGGQFTTTMLDTLMKEFYPGSPRPFLVLDIARPSSTYEAALALGMRNAFATQLLQLRTFSGVLATGLEQPAMLGTLARTVVAAIGRNATMGELAADVRRQFAEPEVASRAGSEADLALAYLGTALLAENPDLPCMMG